MTAVWASRYVRDHYDLPTDGIEWVDDVAGAEVVWQTSDTHFDDAFRPAVTASARVRWLQTHTHGVQTPWFKGLLDRGVRLTMSEGAALPMAEWVLRSVLDHLQRPDRWRAAQAAHRWEPHGFTEVDSTTWLVLGLGSVGVACAVRARALGAHVIGVRRTPDGTEPVDETITMDEVPAALGRADVVVLALPGTRSTDGLVDAAFLAAMKPRSLLVNVGRGSLVDEAALVAALDVGTPAAAALDVASTEPLPADSPLWDHPRITLCPHSSAYGRHNVDREHAAFIANLARWQAGEPLAAEVTAIELP